MQIKISNLKLKNFKGIKNLEINFEGKNANIYGKNATGKTTVFDAFKWLFFDKDSSDRKDFNIKTLDENNKPIHFLEHEVEAILLIDGVDMTFKKMLKEKWVTKRGETQQEFSGHETSYWIDEVPVKKKDYEEKINSLVPESLFKLITDPLYFNKQLKWQERREILTNISGNQITDEEILNANEEFKTLQQNLNGRSIEDYKKVIQSKIKELNNQKESIPIRIDELTNTLVTEHNINYDELEKQKETYNQELKKIETIEKIKMEMADIDTKLNETKVKIENIENEEAKNATIDVTAFPKYQEKLKEVNELQEIVDKLINGDTSEIQGRKNNIIDLINNIDKQLNERAIQERTKERIKELENEEENIANKVQELEAQQYQIEQFTKTKVELLESAINSKFEVVKFRLFDTQINGGLVECCDTLVKGVPYSDVNNAHKILAGLDIINTLIKFYQTSAPIFIDNRESINELYNINAQIISLIVTTDSQLRIEVI